MRIKVPSVLKNRGGGGKRVLRLKQGGRAGSGGAAALEFTFGSAQMIFNYN